jgi:phospholipid N-methyltransferase
MSLADFWVQALSRPRETGAILPSSGKLAELITDAAELGSSGLVVELGPGTGVFTEKILRKIPAGCRYIAIEINPVFAAATNKRFPKAEVVMGSAVDLGKILAARGHKHCDAVISGLPWATMDAARQDGILSAVRDSLAPNGRFVTFAYLHGLLLPAGRRFARRLKSSFGTVEKTKVVWTNFPPAFVYISRK